ncbi:MAG: hypothetical protein V2B18_24660, partial [Pseudomonadota bacterium]
MDVRWKAFGRVNLTDEDMMQTMDDFNQSLFQMVSFRMMGIRILPSLLSLLPQTEIYRDLPAETKLEFCPYLLP